MTRAQSLLIVAIGVVSVAAFILAAQAANKLGLVPGIVARRGVDV